MKKALMLRQSRQDLLRQLALRVLEQEFDSDSAVSAFYEMIERDRRRWLIPPDD